MYKLLICGRTASGKDTVAEALKDAGLRPLVSYTTRPKREGEGDTHIFITDSQVSSYNDIAAYTEINGYKYFSTKELVEECDLYIIDPDGIMDLCRNMPDTFFNILYIECEESIRRERFVRRDPSLSATFDERNEAEKEEFDRFEEDLRKYEDGKKVFPDNIKHIFRINNKGNRCSLEKIVKMELERRKKDMRIYLYKNYNSDLAYGEEYIKLFTEKKDAKSYFWGQVKEAYGKYPDELLKDPAFANDYIDPDGHVEITNDGGDVNYFVVEEKEIEDPKRIRIRLNEDTFLTAEKNPDSDYREICVGIEKHPAGKMPMWLQDLAVVSERYHYDDMLQVIHESGKYFVYVYGDDASEDWTSVNEIDEYKGE